jgi:hypothetical protein
MNSDFEYERAKPLFFLQVELPAQSTGDPLRNVAEMTTLGKTQSIVNPDTGQPHFSHLKIVHPRWDVAATPNHALILRTALNRCQG